VGIKKQNIQLFTKKGIKSKNYQNAELYRAYKVFACNYM